MSVLVYNTCTESDILDCYGEEFIITGSLVNESGNNTENVYTNYDEELSDLKETIKQKDTKIKELTSKLDESSIDHAEVISSLIHRELQFGGTVGRKWAIKPKSYLKKISINDLKMLNGFNNSLEKPFKKETRGRKKKKISPPTIDEMSIKNEAMNDDTCEYVLDLTNYNEDQYQFSSIEPFTNVKPRYQDYSLENKMNPDLLEPSEYEYLIIDNNFNPSIYRCIYQACDKTFPIHLRDGPIHSRRHNLNYFFNEANLPYQCGHCSIKFRYLQERKNHEAIHTRRKRIRCKWPDCNRKFECDDDLEEHFALTHD